MKIKSITLKNVPPIKNFQIDNLSDLVVIAGTNGVGKTRLIESILGYLQGVRANFVCTSVFSGIYKIEDF